MGTREITKGITLLMLFGAVAAGRVSADPPPWSKGRQDRHESGRYESNRDSTVWQGKRPVLDGTLRGRYRSGDRHVTVRSGRTDYQVGLSRASVAAREIPDGARVLVWGDMGRGRRVEAARLAVVLSGRPGDDACEPRPNGGSSYGGGYGGSYGGGYGGDRYGREVTLHGIVTSLDTRAGTFRLRTSGSESYTVQVSNDTRILSKGDHATWGDVREGGRVRVEGTVSRGGTVQARELEGFPR